MKFNEIIKVFEDLARSQGFYGRLLRDIYEMKEYAPDDYEALKNELEAQNFKDDVDVVLFMES